MDCDTLVAPVPRVLASQDRAPDLLADTVGQECRAPVQRFAAGLAATAAIP
jgi:hypothetical protein